MFRPDPAASRHCRAHDPVHARPPSAGADPRIASHPVTGRQLDHGLKFYTGHRAAAPWARRAHCRRTCRSRRTRAARSHTHPGTLRSALASSRRVLIGSFQVAQPLIPPIRAGTAARRQGEGGRHCPPAHPNAQRPGWWRCVPAGCCTAANREMSAPRRHASPRRGLRTDPSVPSPNRHRLA